MGDDQWEGVVVLGSAGTGQKYPQLGTVSLKEPTEANAQIV
jgi:hypothetical protein